MAGGGRHLEKVLELVQLQGIGKVDVVQHKLGNGDVGEHVAELRDWCGAKLVEKRVRRNEVCPAYFAEVGKVVVKEVHPIEQN